MAKTRDKLIHGYFSVEKEIIWGIAEEELPALLPKLRDILEELKKHQK